MVMIKSIGNYIKKIKGICLAPLIFQDYLKFKKFDSKQRFSIRVADFYPCPFDKTFKTNFDRHYIYHTAWAARILAQIKPEKHVDIGSSLYFVGVASAFVPIDFYDYRPVDIGLSNLNSKLGDLLALPFADNSQQSLSCMHVVEHVGLGRYGDKLDPDGDLKATTELKRVLAPGGSLFFVVPIGKPKIVFNAHRIYSYEHVLQNFSDLHLQEFALIPEKGSGIIYDASTERVGEEEYGCGCFWFIKK